MFSQNGASWGTGDLSLTTGKTYTIESCKETCDSNPKCNAITSAAPWERQDLLMDIYSPSNSKSADGKLQRRPGIIVIHGGGFIAGTRTNDFAVEEAQFYAAHGYVAMSIDYRNDVRLCVRVSSAPVESDQQTVYHHYKSS